MKGILKLFPVAMAVLALASCSDIDSLESKNGAAVAEDGDLVISFDPMEVDGEAVATRGMRTKTPSTLNFEEGDLVNVYDADLYKHDVYEYEPGSPKGKFNVIAPQRITTGSQYALYPAGAVKRGYWDRESDMSIAEFAIEPIITYNASSEAKIGDEMYYSYELPSAGKAEWNASANRVDVKNFRALTGILQLNLEDALYNANWIKISSGKKISGTFKVVLDTNAWDAIKLEEGDEDLITDNAIYVDMRQVPSRINCVYVPIIAGIDTNVDGLTVEVAKDDVDDPTTIVAGNWYDTGLKFPNKVIAANKIYRGTKQFSLTDMTPNKVTEMLAQYQTSASDIVLELADKFTIGADGSTEGCKIKLPQFDNNINVTINLASTFTTWTNATATGLVFEDADASKPFKGTVTLNVKGNLPASANATTHVNLAEGSYVIAGDFTNAALQSLFLTKAKSVSVGDGTTATKLTPGAVTYGAIENLTIAAEAEYNKDITTTANNTNVIINGKVDGNIDMTSCVKNRTLLRIHGREANATATPAITAKAAEVTGNVTAMCNVTIDLTAEGIAIASGKTLTLNGYDNTLTLVQGYVDKFVAKVTNTGSWEESKVNVKLDSDNEGLAAFKTIDAQNDANGELTKIDFTESVWDGKIIGAAFTDYKAKTTTYQENSTDKTGKAVFTASQLASLGTAADVVLVANDIDLKSKDTWVGFNISSRLQGILPGEDAAAARTIKNLCLTNAAAKGLINANTATQINNLKLVGVTATKAADADGVGALIGANTAAVTIENVTISGINLAAASGKKLSKVGGIVGTNSTAALTLNNVTTAGTIDGYTELGGLVGATSSNVTTDKDCASTVTFAQTYNSGNDFDIRYAKIGGFIGTVTNNADITILASAEPTIPTHKGSSIEYISSEGEDAGKFYAFTASQGYVGYSGAANFTANQDAFPAGSANLYTAGSILVKKADGSATTKTFLLPAFGTNNKKWNASNKQVDLADGEAIIYSFAKK